MGALLLFADSERSAAMRHEVPLAVMDPFLFADVDERRLDVLVEEAELAQRQARWTPRERADLRG